MKRYGKEIFKLPIQILHNIFNHPSRKLTDHDLAYTLINSEYKRSHNSNIFILLPSLDGKKLSKENIEDSILSRDLHIGMMPAIESEFLSNSIQKQNQMQNQIIKFQDVIQSQQSNIENLTNEIKSLNVVQKSQSSEIDELRNAIKTLANKYDKLEKKTEKDKENYLKDINELKQTIEKQKTEIDDLKK